MLGAPRKFLPRPLASSYSRETVKARPPSGIGPRTKASASDSQLSRVGRRILVVPEGGGSTSSLKFTDLQVSPPGRPSVPAERGIRFPRGARTHVESDDSRRCNCHVGCLSAAALAPLAARSSAAAPSSPVGSRRLAAAVQNNVIGSDSSRRAAGAASSPIFGSTSLSTNLCQSSCCLTERRSRPVAAEMRPR